MNINEIVLAPTDYVMAFHNVGNLPSEAVDEYCSKIITKLVEVFGRDRVALFPVREGDSWEFTIIRKQ
jgi:hypothetical protein